MTAESLWNTTARRVNHDISDTWVMSDTCPILLRMAALTLTRQAIAADALHDLPGALEAIGALPYQPGTPAKRVRHPRRGPTAPSPVQSPQDGADEAQRGAQT